MSTIKYPDALSDGSLGAKTAAKSESVVLATDATLPLPTGAATAALQTQPGVDIGDVTVNNAGQSTMASSIPVVVASDQTSIPVTVTSRTGAVLSTGNSSSTPLTGNATFTGTTINALNYEGISVTAYSDKASATNGLKIQLSSDGTNWTDHVHSVSASANTLAFLATGLNNQYARILYTNGSQDQTTFRLQTILHNAPMNAESISMSDPISATDHGLLTKGVIAGVTTAGGGGYIDVKVNPSGALTAEVTYASLGQTTMANSVPVTVASDQGHFSVDQHVTTSSTNSSTANLTSGSTFTGTGISTLGVNAIQVSLKTDKDCTVYVDQSPDNSNWDVTDTYNYYKLINNFGITVQAINSYVRVRVKNIDTATTSYLRLQTVLCPVVEVLPRSLDTNGFLKCATSDIYNWDTGNRARIDQFNTIKVGEVTRLVGATFSGSTKDTNFWAENVAGTGSVAQALGAVTLQTGATANSTALYQTARTARFVAYATNIFRGVIKVGDTGATNNTRRWGAFSTTSGLFFELAGTTLKCVTRYNSNDSALAQTDWTKFNRFTLDTNYHVYEIWMGYQGAQFFINGTLVHTVSLGATPFSDTLTLPAALYNGNSGGGTSDVTLSAILCAIARLGKLQTAPQYKNIASNATTVCKYGAGTLHSIVVNKTGSGNTLTIYDNTAASGTIIGAISGSTVGGNFDYRGLPFATGLTILTASGSAGNYTVIYE